MSNNGIETVVEIPFEGDCRLAHDRVPLSDFLNNSPLCGAEIDLTRDKSPLRDAFDLSKKG